MNKKVIMISVALVLVVAAIAASIMLGKSEDKKPMASDTSTEQTSSVPQTIAPDPSLIADCRFSKVFSYDGAFVEDGSDEQVKGVAAVTVTNHGTRDIEYMKLTVNCGKEKYSFSLMTLPAGKTVTVLEQNKKSFAGNGEITSHELENIAYFENPLTFLEDMVEVYAVDGIMTVKNITGSDFGGDVYVYYKNIDENGFFGGITYRVKFAGVKADDYVQSVAAHYTKENSKVVFVSYAENQSAGQ